MPGPIPATSLRVLEPFLVAGGREFEFMFLRQEGNVRQLWRVDRQGIATAFGLAPFISRLEEVVGGLVADENGAAYVAVDVFNIQPRPIIVVKISTSFRQRGLRERPAHSVASFQW